MKKARNNGNNERVRIRMKKEIFTMRFKIKEKN